MTMNLNERPQEACYVQRENPGEAPGDANSRPDLKKKRSWKKPKDKPMRPLSAYNMFFQNQRERIVAGKTGDPTPEEIQQSVIKMLTSKTRGPKRRQDRVSHGQISFGDLARTIAAKWKAIDPKLKAIYNHYAAQEKVRYKKEVVIWKEKKEREHDVALAAKQHSLLASSSSYNDSMMSMSSSVTSMSTSISTSYDYSQSINSLQNGVGMQLNDDVVQRQQDILRQQMGFIDSKPQARMDNNNDNVSRELPKQELGDGSGDINLQAIQFPRPIGGNGMASGMNMMGMDNSGNDCGSLLDANLQQQQQINHKEQLLLQLQQQQLQQLQQLQQAREETSRRANMKTTDTFINCMQPSKMTMNGEQEFPPPRLTNSTSNNNNNNSSNSQKHGLQAQFKELENITFELDRLKEQERQMQRKIKEHQTMTNQNPGLWPDDNAFGNRLNPSPEDISSGNFNSGTEFTSSLNDTGTNLRSTFDMDNDRQRMVRRSRSGDTNIYRNRLAGSNQFRAGQRRPPRRHSSETQSGFSSAPNSFNYGSKLGMGNSNNGMLSGMGEGSQQQQIQNQGRRDSLSGLLQLDDINNMDVVKQQQQQQQQQGGQEQSQNYPNTLSALFQMQNAQSGGNNGVRNNIGSIFNMDLGGSS